MLNQITAKCLCCSKIKPHMSFIGRMAFLCRYFDDRQDYGRCISCSEDL